MKNLSTFNQLTKEQTQQVKGGSRTTFCEWYVGLHGSDAINDGIILNAVKLDTKSNGGGLKKAKGHNK